MPEVGEIRAARDVGWKGKRSLIWAACIGCGKERWTPVIKGKPQRTLCMPCAKMGKMTGAANPRYKGKVKRNCEECGKEIEVYPYTQKLGQGRFCSSLCSLINHWKVGQIKREPNAAERWLINLLEQSRLPFKYVGDGQMWLENRNPDFIATNGLKLVIEIFGTYWHAVADVQQRTEHYKTLGFNSLILWDYELTDSLQILKRVELFMRT
jgi:G:T-mismatch repair DNA endonuclease (very short patch repair protein)